MPRQKALDDTKLQVPGLAHRKAESETGRDRNWERRQRMAAKITQVSYRGIERELNDAMKALAAEHGVSVSEIARLFLWYGLGAVESGELEIKTRPAQSARQVVDLP